MVPSRSFHQRLDLFLGNLSAIPDPRLEAWSSPGGQGDARRALVAGCISQDLSLPAVARLLRELDQRLGEGLLAPWTRRLETIEAACRLPWLDAWPHRDSLAGWIVAVGDLLRESPDPTLWSSSWADPRDFVKILASRIPWMGRKSTDRVKGWRIARWLVRGEGLTSPLWPTEAKARLALPSPVLSTPLGWFGLLPPTWDSWTPRRRQEWTDSVVKAIRPDDPASAWVPLETILRRGKLDHRCAELLGGCETCPLRKECNG